MCNQPPATLPKAVSSSTLLKIPEYFLSKCHGREPMGIYTTGAGCTRGRSALSRLFDGGKGLGQHAFGVASPLVELGLGGILHRWGEFFNIPHFRHARAGTAGLQTVGPAHIRAFVGARHEFEAPAALGHGDQHWHRPRTLAGPVVADVAIAHLATAAALPLAADVFGAPLPHARESGDEVVDGFWGRIDLDTGFTMHTMDGHESAPS